MAQTVEEILANVDWHGLHPMDAAYMREVAAVNADNPDAVADDYEFILGRYAEDDHTGPDANPLFEWQISAWKVENAAPDVREHYQAWYDLYDTWSSEQGGLSWELIEEAEVIANALHAFGGRADAELCKRDVMDWCNFARRRMGPRPQRRDAYEFRDGTVAPAHTQPVRGRNSGWIADSASVAEGVWVPPGAEVSGQAIVSASARLGHHAHVGGRAEVAGAVDGWADGHSRVGPGCQVYWDGRIEGDATLIGGAVVRGRMLGGEIVGDVYAVVDMCGGTIQSLDRPLRICGVIMPSAHVNASGRIGNGQMYQTMVRNTVIEGKVVGHMSVGHVHVHPEGIIEGYHNGRRDPDGEIDYTHAHGQIGGTVEPGNGFSGYGPVGVPAGWRMSGGQLYDATGDVASPLIAIDDDGRAYVWAANEQTYRVGIRKADTAPAVRIWAQGWRGKTYDEMVAAWREEFGDAAVNAALLLWASGVDGARHPDPIPEPAPEPAPEPDPEPEPVPEPDPEPEPVPEPSTSATNPAPAENVPDPDPDPDDDDDLEELIDEFDRRIALHTRRGNSARANLWRTFKSDILGGSTTPATLRRAQTGRDNGIARHGSAPLWERLAAVLESLEIVDD